MSSLRWPLVALGAALALAACADDATPPPSPPEQPPATVELTRSEDCAQLRETVLASTTEAILHARYGGIEVDDKLGGKGDDTDSPEDDTVELESAPPAVETEDLVKVVDDRVLVLSDDRLTIVSIDETGALNRVGYFGVGDQLSALGMFADAETAVLVHTIDDDHDSAPFAGTRVTFVDLSDPSQPELAHQVDLEGGFEMARREGGTITLATSAPWRVDRAVWELAYGDGADLPATEPNADALRQQELRAAARDGVRTQVAARLAEIDAEALLPRLRSGDQQAQPLVACDAIWGATPAASVRLTTLTRFEDGELRSSFGVIGDDFAGDVAGKTVFAAFTDRWGAFAGDSRLHAFDVDGALHATRSVGGALVDEFSIAAHDALVSLITVDEAARLHAFDFADGGLEPHDEVPTLPDGERVVANRITPTAAYVATGGESERIYALPLGESDVDGPFEVGGLPTMIHSLAEQRILVVAQDNDDKGKQIGVRIELFESDTDPVATAAISTGEFAAWSEAMWEPRSLAYAPTGLVAFPVNIEAWEDAGGANFSGVLVYDTSTGIERRTAIDHSELRNTRWCRDNDQPDDCEAPSATPWWTHVRRTVFIGGRIVTVSEVGIKAHDGESFAEVGSLTFD